MPVSDTDFNMIDLHQSEGGGEGENIYSSTHSISTEKTEEGWDINVNGDKSLRIYVNNFHEFMDAILLVADKYDKGDKTNCVIQLMNDIDMTAPTAEDEQNYVLGSHSFIERSNKRYNFGIYLYYTSIVCDGTKRILQTIFPRSGTLDTWTLQCEKIMYDNVNIGGNITKYDQIHGTHTPQNTVPAFSRYLLRSNGNPSIKIHNCQITCCGADQEDPDSYNPFIEIGTGSNTSAGLYHSRIEITNCLFFHGGSSGGESWANCNAPIVIYSRYDQNYQRTFIAKQLSKSINDTEAETGVPNIQFRSPNLVYRNPWEVETDGTCLVSHDHGDEYLILKSRTAINDMFIQGQPDFQPEGASNTYNWVSLVDELKARLKTGNKLSQAEIEGIVSSGVGAQENKYLDGIGLGAVVRGLTSSHYLHFWGNPTSGFTISQSEISDCVTKILRGDKVIPILLLLDASLNSLCTFIPVNIFPDSQTTIKFVYISYYPTMIGRFEVTASLVGSTSTIQFIQ